MSVVFVFSLISCTYAQYLPFYNNQIHFVSVNTFGSPIKVSAQLIVNQTGVSLQHPGHLILPEFNVYSILLGSNSISTGILSSLYTTWGICQDRIYFNIIPSMCTTSRKIVYNCSDWSELEWVDTSITINQFSHGCTQWNLSHVDCTTYLYNDITKVNPLLSNYSMFYNDGECILYEDPSDWETAIILIYSIVVGIAYLEFTYISAGITENVLVSRALDTWKQFLVNAFMFNEIIALVVFIKAYQLVFGTLDDKYLPVVEYAIGRSTADTFYSVIIVYDVLLSCFVAFVLITQQQLPDRFARTSAFIRNHNQHKDATFIVFSMSVELVLVYSLVQFTSVGMFPISNVELMNVLIGCWLLYQLGSYTTLVWFTGTWMHVLLAFTNVCVFFTYATLFLLMPQFVGPFSMSKDDPWPIVLIASGLTSCVIGSHSKLQAIRHYQNYVGVPTYQ